MARRMQAEPTTRYAMPRNGLRPPSHDVVVRIIRFVPSNTVTGYSGKAARDTVSSLLRESSDRGET